MTKAPVEVTKEEPHVLNKSTVHPKLSKEELKRYYPDNLKLKLVQIVHRHGERTPIQSYIPSFVSPVWALCHVNSSFHANLGTFKSQGSSEDVGGKGSFAREEHSQDHPGTEWGSPKDAGALIDSAIAQGSDVGRGNRYISNENLASLGTVQRQLEDPLFVKHHSKDETQPVAGQCFFGQLTDKGRETLFQVGKSFRWLYVDTLKFLPQKMSHENQNTFYFRTTDYPRTLESLHHLIGGLYPYRTHRDPKYSPVVHTRWLNEETLFAQGSCKKWRRLVNDFASEYRRQNKDHIESMRAKHKNMLNDMAKPNLHALYDTFIAVHAHGIGLPSSISESDLKALETHAQSTWFEVYRKSQEAVRLSIGRFVAEMKRTLESATSPSPQGNNLKLAIYSGHDSTIAPLLGAFQINDGRWPPFASNVVIELFEDSNDRENYVRMKYNGSIVHVPFCQNDDLHHKKDKSLCRLKVFFDLMEQSIPKDFEKECIDDGK
ncbi:hypothetical protein MP638_007291 [Amoeboaphelidium occidentale]|nr:hypothetical protein MP638_007291 [Amoeboaphelidium occidentale]